jgi:hypothetical protein
VEFNALYRVSLNDESDEKPQQNSTQMTKLKNEILLSILLIHLPFEGHTDRLNIDSESIFSVSLSIRDIQLIQEG